MIDKVDGNRIGGEYNKYIAEMWRSLTTGCKPPIITKQDYHEIKINHNKYPYWLVGWVGIACSYSGKWFGGFAGKTSTKGGDRDYQTEAHVNLEKQLPKLI